MEFLIFDSVFLKPKRKIYILSKNVPLRICRPHLDKQLFISTFYSYVTYFVQIMEFFNYNRI